MVGIILCCAAVMQNRELFEGKVVLDVGTGSGILAIWAAKAGASRVYAIEYTEMAKHAQALVNHNGVADVVQVIQVPFAPPLGDVAAAAIIERSSFCFILIADFVRRFGAAREG